MIVVEQIDSQQLAGNAIGDPSRRDLVVYLPPGYHTSTRHYPTAYLLHGFSSRAMHWTSDMLGGGVLYRAIDPVLDEVIGARRAAEMIVVMPDGWSKWGCSQWVDSPVNGNFEQYVAREVVAHVDGHYRTIPAAASRGVFGISSGGLGAWHLGSRNPNVFAAMALLSADSYFDLTHRAWLYRYYNNVFPGEPRGPVSGDEYSWLAYGLGSCYTPNVNNPPYYVDLPIEFPSGALIEPLWERWLSYDPVVSWRARADNLRRMRGILLDAGAHDQYDLQIGHRILHRDLTGAGIAHDFEEHAGTHTSLLYERIQATLGWFSQVLDIAP